MTTVNTSTESKPIRIVIADDHPIVRDGLRKLLSQEPDFEIVGEAGDGREALDKLQTLNPDILLLDLRMPMLDGIGTLQALQVAPRPTRVIIITASDDKSEFVRAMKLGCRGILLKQTPPDLIVKSIRKVYAGEIWLDSTTTTAVMESFSSSPADSSRLPSISPSKAPAPKSRERSPLSTRELEIVQLVAQGYKNKEMAEKMFISEQTVKNHLHNIFDKLSVSDRLELALYAIHKGLHLSNHGGSQ